MEFEHKGQRFRVVPAYEGQSHYVEASTEASESYETLWRENVIEPYRDECFAGESRELAERQISQPVLDFGRLSESVDSLRGSNVEGVVESALRESADALPNSDKTVCVFVATDSHLLSFSEYDFGANGVASGSERFVIFINPESKDWKDDTPHVIAHEYHHTVWTRWWISENPDEEIPFDLANYLVFEGRAESFASELYPDVETPYTDALSAEEEREMWEKMSQNLGESDPEILYQYAFGGPGVPRWTLYTVGFDIVRSYVEKNPNVDTEELLEKDPREVISRSGYEGR